MQYRSEEWTNRQKNPLPPPSPPQKNSESNPSKVHLQALVSHKLIVVDQGASFTSKLYADGADLLAASICPRKSKLIFVTAGDVY